MSIATRTGDDGSTSLMFGRRLSKSHPRVVAYGNIDELNSVLGLARASTTDTWIGRVLLETQKELVGLMGELAVDVIDGERYRKAGYACVEPEHLKRLDGVVAELEGREITFDGWATPGENMHSAALDMARSVCRRSERGVVSLIETNEKVNSLALKYLNRLSDVLWLLARYEETQTKTN